MAAAAVMARVFHDESGEYSKICGELEADRLLLSHDLEMLRIPVKDLHKAEWERQARLAEREELKIQLTQAARQLAECQQALLDLTEETQVLRTCVPHWEADLDQLMTAARPRVEELRFRSGSLPEKVGGFSLHATSEPSRQRMTFSSPPQGAGPTLMQYMPHDEQALRDDRLVALKACLEEVRTGRAEAHTVWDRLLRTEDEEGSLALHVLEEQLVRLRQDKELVREHADTLIERQMALKAQSASRRDAFEEEVRSLEATEKELSAKLAATLLQRCAEAERLSIKGGRARQRAAETSQTGILRAREDVTFLQEELVAEEERGAKRIKALEEQLGVLRRRYNALAGHRRAQAEALRKDVQSLQRAVRQCESLATRSITLQPGTNFAPTQLVEALAMKPTVARLKQVLQRCEDSLRTEEAGAAWAPADVAKDCGAAEIRDHWSCCAARRDISTMASGEAFPTS